MRLRARDHHTLVCGKGGIGPRSPHTTLKGPPEYVNARWMWSLHGFHPTWHRMDHLDYFQKLSLGGRPNTKPRDHGTMNTHDRWFTPFYHVCGHAWTNIHWNSRWLRARSQMAWHSTWGSVTTLHDFGGVLGTSFGPFLVGSHGFVVTTLGSCVKWPKSAVILC